MEEEEEEEEEEALPVQKEANDTHILLLFKCWLVKMVHVLCHRMGVLAPYVVHS